MGGKCPHRKVKKRRLSHKTARRGKFLVKADDAVYDELVKLADAGKDADATQLPVDEDLPGMGQFYCLHCDQQQTQQAKAPAWRGWWLRGLSLLSPPSSSAEAEEGGDGREG